MDGPPAESSNSALWIVGHIVWARSRALKLLGVYWTAPWFNHFERGSKPADASQYPSSEEVLAAWKELSATLAARAGSSARRSHGRSGTAAFTQL